MNEQELAAELMIWLPTIEAGVTLEAVYAGGSATRIVNILDLISFIKSSNLIRIKQGESLNSPESRKYTAFEATRRRYLILGYGSEEATKLADALFSGDIPNTEVIY